MTDRIAFTGCSFVEGQGFDPEIREKFCFPWLVGKHLNCEIDNLSSGGANHSSVFFHTINAIRRKKYKVVCVFFTKFIYRFWFSPAPNVWLYLDKSNRNFKNDNLLISSRELQKFFDLQLLLHHPFQHILNLVDYCHAIKAVASENDTKVIFWNPWIPWNDFLNSTANMDFETLSDFTKELLDVQNRPDDEISMLLSQLQAKAQELDPIDWIFFDCVPDTFPDDIGPQGHHPGPAAHAYVAKLFSERIQSRKLI